MKPGICSIAEFNVDTCSRPIYARLACDDILDSHSSFSTLCNATLNRKTQAVLLATLATDPALFGVLPILPAAGSILVVIAVTFGSLVAALISLRLSSVRQLISVTWRQKWGLVTVTLAVLLAIKAIALTAVRPQIETHPAPLVTHVWPQFRGSSMHSGHADRQPGPVRGGIQWSLGRGFDFYSSPAIVGEHVIAVGCQGDSARFFCCQATTGDQVWSVAPSGYRATFSSPVVDRGFLICGEGLHQTTGSRLTCFDLTHGTDPQICTQFTTRSHIECTPVVVDGRIYLGAGDDGIYCLELPSRPGADLREIWHLPGDKYPDAETAIAVHQGRVYMGLGFGGEALCVLDAETGRELQRVKLPQPVFSPPAILDNRIYLGLGCADYVNFRTSPPGEVRCMDLQTLETIWTIPTGSAVLAAIVATPEEIYFSTVGGHVNSVDRNGRITHSWSARAPMLTAPAVTDRMVYCVACDGVLTGLNRRLQRVWSERLGSPGDYLSSPVVFQGHAYVGTPEDGLLCIGQPSPNSESQSAFFNSGSILPAVSTIPRTAEFEWVLSQPVQGEWAEVTAAPAVAPAGVYVPISNKDWTGIVRADFIPAGPPQPKWIRKIPERINIPPHIRGEQVICLCGDPGQPGQLVALDRESGNLNWNYSVEITPAGMLVDADSVYVETRPRQLTRWNLRGELQWQIDPGLMTHPVQVCGAIAVIATSSPTQLKAFDRSTGSLLWEVDVPERATAAPLVHETHVLVPTAKSLEQRSLVDGSLQALLNGWAGVISLSVDAEQMIGVTSRGDVLIGATNGVIRQRWGGADPALTPLIGFDSVVFADNAGHLLRGHLDGNEKAQPWFAPLDNGRVAHSPVVLDERVYVPVAERGLMCLKAGGLP